MNFVISSVYSELRGELNKYLMNQLIMISKLVSDFTVMSYFLWGINLWIIFLKYKGKDEDIDSSMTSSPPKTLLLSRKD